ncbi:MAG: DUF1933 domain-containing protein [Proteobacteria bacterium]|nr:DUF1933 domain-containing protein [Pseudomonadota bacterium]
MAGLMVHRGPDDSGYWLSASLAHGFAHRRLSILDLSERGHQPMLDERGLAVACYNGEIYNFAELRKDLIDRGWQFRSASDTEVLLKGYLEYGRDIVAKLNGIFAFAIHDLRSGETFLARDQLGVKPLYLAELAGTVLFASELKSLLADARVSRDLDSVALHRYLTFLVPGESTPLRAVRRMEPGTAALVRDGRVIRTWKYYQTSFGSAVRMSIEDCTQGVVQRLRAGSAASDGVGCP